MIARRAFCVSQATFVAEHPLEGNKCMGMQAIMLDEKQTSIVTQCHDSVQVCDHTGGLLGHIVPILKSTDRYEDDRWIASWDEWYTATED